MISHLCADNSVKTNRNSLVQANECEITIKESARAPFSSPIFRQLLEAFSIASFSIKTGYTRYGVQTSVGATLYPCVPRPCLNIAGVSEYAITL